MNPTPSAPTSTPDRPFSFLESDVETVLLGDLDGARRAQIRKDLEEMRCRFSEPATPDEAVAQMRFHDFHVVILHESFGGADPAHNPVRKFLAERPMSTRRNIFLVLLVEQGRSQDPLLTFYHSVDLLLHTHDLPDLCRVLKRDLFERRAFYRMFREVSEKLGKG